MQLQSVRFLRASFPNATGDIAAMPIGTADLMRKAKTVEFVEVEPEAPRAARPAAVFEQEVKIPDDWQDLHHKVQMALASRIIGEVVATKEKAIEVIGDELFRRAATA